MPPRPTPDDSLFAHETPHLSGRRSGLMGGLLDLPAGGIIELTSSDPLSKPPDCDNDAEIAALLEAEWNAAPQAKKKTTVPENSAQRKDHVQAEKVLGGVWLLLVILGVGVYLLLK